MRSGVVPAAVAHYSAARRLAGGLDDERVADDAVNRLILLLLFAENLLVLSALPLIPVSIAQPSI